MLLPSRIEELRDDFSSSSLKGTTTYRVSGGAAGSKRAVFVTSNDDGSYTVSPPAGKYWIGSPAKARGPTNYMLGAAEVVEQVVVVQEQAWTDVNVLELGNAP